MERVLEHHLEGGVEAEQRKGEPDAVGDAHKEHHLEQRLAVMMAVGEKGGKVKQRAVPHLVKANDARHAQPLTVLLLFYFDFALFSRFLFLLSLLSVFSFLSPAW